MSFLVLTIGNSDIQFNRNELEFIEETNFTFTKNGESYLLKFENTDIVNLIQNRNYTNWLLLKQNRIDGQTLLYNMAKIANYLHFPLIKPIVDYLNTNNIKVKNIGIIYTDQEDQRFRVSDTLYTKGIIKSWLSNLFPLAKFDEIGIDKVTDIDELYPKFRDKVLSWRKDLEEGDEVFLADQGGIDQINQSIRLQILQAFKTRAHILQKAEETSTKELNFPQLFLKDLARQNIIKHVQDFDFDKVDDTLQPESWVIKLCHYAAARLSLNYSYILNVQQLQIMLSAQGNQQLIPNINWKKLDRVEQNRIKIVDLYLAAKIAFYQKRYNEFLWRIFTVNENLTQDETDKLLGYDSMHRHFKFSLKPIDQNSDWEVALNTIDSCLLNNLKAQDIFIHNPNRYTYKAIYLFLVKNNLINERIPTNEYIELSEIIESLSGKRNGLAHKMGTITEQEIRKLIPHEKSFFNYLDKWFSITDFDLYGNIREYILAHYE